MDKKGNLFVQIYRALFVPDKAFTDGSVFAVRRIGIIAVLLVLVIGGSILSLSFHQNDVMRTLTIDESIRRIDKMMASAPAEARQEAVDRVTSQMSGGAWSVQMIIGTIVGSGFWMVMVLEAWFLSIILMQFLGGEEQPLEEKKHRRSFYLASYMFIPLGLQEVIRGIILLFKDPVQIGNVLTLAEYTEATEVSFSLLSLFDLPDLPGIVTFLATNLTNPFFLWACAVALFGGIGIFRIKAGKMAIAVLVIVVLFGLQTQLINLVQGGLGG